MVTVTLASAFQFNSHSPRQRLCVVADPVSYGGVGVYLFRYENYGSLAVQPGTAALPAVLPDRALLATDLVSAMSSFVITPGSLNRNAIVHLALTFTVGGEQLSLNHEVGLRNVP